MRSTIQDSINLYARSEASVDFRYTLTNCRPEISFPNSNNSNIVIFYRVNTLDNRDKMKEIKLLISG
ncbi:MAG: hypothetical protein MjAS7_0549 [Metallosphaera javensis (ex Sakai et al. 2022)]|nr:MAG: hypothetical protein MjAS7_0549 [Metallosphaera javensis (ex Sakai et al. 2022)]